MKISKYDYARKKGYWETKDHKLLKIKEMETSHIENVIKFLQKRPDFYDEYFYCYDGMCPEDSFSDYINNKDLVDKKIEELELELRFRKLEDNESN